MIEVKVLRSSEGLIIVEYSKDDINYTGILLAENTLVIITYCMFIIVGIPNLKKIPRYFAYFASRKLCECVIIIMIKIREKFYRKFI